MSFEYPADYLPLLEKLAIGPGIAGVELHPEDVCGEKAELWRAVFGDELIAVKLVHRHGFDAYGGFVESTHNVDSAMVRAVEMLADGGCKVFVRLTDKGVKVRLRLRSSTAVSSGPAARAVDRDNWPLRPDELGKIAAATPVGQRACDDVEVEERASAEGQRQAELRAAAARAVLPAELHDRPFDTDLKAFAVEEITGYPSEKYGRESAKREYKRLQYAAAKKREKENAAGDKARLTVGRRRRPPCDDAFRAYIAYKFANQTQDEVGKELRKTQGRVSNWIKQVELWIGAGNALPEKYRQAIACTRTIAMDPALIDAGERQESGAKARLQDRKRRDDDDE
jgi:hypothetical protein